MDNIMISSGFSSTVKNPLNQITFFWEIMLIEVDNLQKLYVCCLLIRLNILRIFFFLEGIMKALQLIESMVFMKSAKEDTAYK